MALSPVWDGLALALANETLNKTLNADHLGEAGAAIQKTLGGGNLQATSSAQSDLAGNAPRRFSEQTCLGAMPTTQGNKPRGLWARAR
jgi:hypothetical protein